MTDEQEVELVRLLTRLAAIGFGQGYNVANAEDSTLNTIQESETKTAIIDFVRSLNAPRPMSEAPRDGTQILLKRGNVIVLGFFDILHDQWTDTLQMVAFEPNEIECWWPEPKAKD